MRIHHKGHKGTLRFFPSRPFVSFVVKVALLAAVPLLASASSFATTSQSDLTRTQWSWPLYIIIPLLLTAALYGIGVIRLWRRTAQVPVVSVLCFAGGWISLLLALDSPIHELSEQLFWVHMTQHEILMLVSAPLLVLAQPLAPALWAFPERERSVIAAVGRWPVVKRAWMIISVPAVAWLLHALALWLWHAPRLFIGALENDAVHAAQHISFLATALLFWWTLLHNHGGRLGYGGAILYVFTTAVHTSVLGAWLTFAPTVWYLPYLQTAPAWHLTALEDQQLGGLIMWVPAGTLLTIVALVLLAKWIKESQRRWEYTRTAEFMRLSQGVAHE
jgi:putative membrane protein